MARSVLRVADQAAERFPDLCVLSGEATSHAARLTATQWDGPRWLLGVPGFAPVVGRLPGHERCPVALPLSVRVWRMWQRRNVAGLTIMVFGLVVAVAGAAQGSAQTVALGVLTGAAGAAYRARAVHNYWVTCRFRPSTNTIIVEPTHPRFDAAARELYVRSIG